MVASTKALTELATFLPHSSSDLLKISGFGPATVAKYGQQFLKVVLEYCSEHELESLIHEKTVPKRVRKDSQSSTTTSSSTNPQREDSKKISFDLYKQGLSIDEIAKKRGYANSTVKVHLAHYVKSKEIPLSDFVTPEQQSKIKEIMKTTTSFSDIYSALKGKVGYTEIGMVVALMN
jgi:ATP-dependent DNA helicase RecQ